MEMDEKYCASMVLSGVGDAIGYKNGRWEFERNPKQLLKEYNDIGGYAKINVEYRNWRVSDDTIMHLATAIAITRDNGDDFEKICQEIATAYIRSLEDMGGRAPGRQSVDSLSKMTPGMKKTPLKWNEVPYSNSGGGCGGAMRSMCIGLKYCTPESFKDLVRYSIESGRITHNHPVGFLGAFVSALFTSYAVQGVAPRQWGRRLMSEGLPAAKQYLQESEVTPHRTMEVYERGWNYFYTAWEAYLKERHLTVGTDNEAVFPETYGFLERDAYYNKLSFDGWGGSSGHDSVIIAYDAVLSSGSSWKEMIERSAIHGGDSDSTAAIGCAWWGALYGFAGVPDCNYKTLEFRPELYSLAQTLLKQRK